ncbi:MAG: hypothetical protein DBX59_02330 [Bacillota bacterium]|nr:MAG: hypothetical protein DBX59_02330 [Bacillota bacterium]
MNKIKRTKSGAVFTTARRKRVIFRCLMLLLPVLHFVLFWGVPHVLSIAYAFQYNRVGEDMFYHREWSTIQFQFVWQELTKPSGNQLLPALLYSCFYFFVGNMISLPATLLLSYFLYKKIFMYKVYRVIFFLPSIISAVVLSILFRNFFDPVSGSIVPLSQLFGASSVPNFIGNPATKHWAVLTFTLWTGFGTNLLLFNSAMARVPAEVMESTQLDGVGMTRELCQFIIPLIWPTLSSVLLLSLSGFFGFVQPILLLEQETVGGNRFSEAASIGYYIYYYMTTRKELLSALGLCFTVLSVPIVFFCRWGLNKISEASEY